MRPLPSDSLDPVSQADPDLQPVRREHPPGTIRIGQIAGIDVLVTSTWFLIAALIAIALSPRVEQVQPGLGVGKYVAGLAFAVVLYLSVLAHEAAHALMARHYGHLVSSITLHFLGGEWACAAIGHAAADEDGEVAFESVDRAAVRESVDAHAGGAVLAVEIHQELCPMEFRVIAAGAPERKRKSPTSPAVHAHTPTEIIVPDCTVMQSDP